MSDRRIIAVFGSSATREGDSDYSVGMECGRLLADAGFDVATGGYLGLMEAACRGAAEAGGSTIGVTAPAVFPGRTGANAWVHRELQADDLVSRIGLLVDIADGCIALPGSIGTLAELVVAWNLAYVAPFTNRRFGPIATVGETWQELIPLLTTALDSNSDSITICASVPDAVRHMVESLA